jgi:hypothetical protein
MTRLRIVLASSFLAGYPEGGGHWTVFLQYLLGLAALGHDAYWLELFRGSDDPARDELRVETFFERMAEYGFGERAVLLWYGPEVKKLTLETARPCGMSALGIADLVRSADLVWNFACNLRQPLLGLFRRRVLVDLDPGHLQVSALTWEMDIAAHDAFLTVGTNVHGDDCEVPTLGVRWHPFTPFVHLPMWEATPDPGPAAPFSSVTQWKWEQVWLGERRLSVSKRDAYMRYLDMPARTGRPFELAANIHPEDRTGDREALLRQGWRLVDPHQVAGSPAAYRDYIARARAEFACPKPVHRELRSGWFSDRSACYLASGRPVVTEDTGLRIALPTGEGLIVFDDVAGAAEGVKMIDAEYTRHARAARAIAEDILDARGCLPAMLAASG